MTTTTYDGAVSLSERELDLLDGYWRPANYLSAREVGDDPPDVRDWTWQVSPGA